MEELLLVADGEGGPERGDGLAHLRAGDLDVLHADLERVVADSGELETRLEVERMRIVGVLRDGGHGGELGMARLDGERNGADVGHDDRRGVGFRGRTGGGRGLGGGRGGRGGDDVGRGGLVGVAGGGVGGLGFRA